MKRFTANYSNTNHNFVIQNLEGDPLDSSYLPAVYILKNILQRGCPTLMSKYLQSKLGPIHKEEAFEKPVPLIDGESPNWERIIRGDVKGNYFPARKFYEELLPKYLGEYAFCRQLIIPEMPINEITKVEVDRFKNQQVDFYLPQAFLIIEIDGSGHDAQRDSERDIHTKKYGIKTVRIMTNELEAENEAFRNKIQMIKDRIISTVEGDKRRKEKGEKPKELLSYKSYFASGYNLNDTKLISTAVVRLQMMLLECLIIGKLDLEKSWELDVLNHDVEGYEEIAIEDLFNWLEHLLKLQKIKFKRPVVKILKTNPARGFSNSGNRLKVDFSLLKRYTDEFQTQGEIVFIRTDYLDEYFYFKKGDATGQLKFTSIEPYDYFRISTTNLIKYDLQFGGEDGDEKSLFFLLENIFLQDMPNLSFNEGQLPIIINALSRRDTIGLLPTGSGKSVCYQLAALLQPAVSFVVCPIKSLMYDQKADLDSVYIKRTNYITSEKDAEDKERIQHEFGSGKYFFIFISPERFQTKTFREYFSKVNKDYNVAYAVIDEVHCLSEWGHDFRTSYLNLSNTIQKLCSEFNFIGLTATASIQVLKDIKIEFGIKDEDVVTPSDYTRKELEFEVLDDNMNKEKAILDTLSELDERLDIFDPDGDESRCGIIFTPTVNGKKGCYPLSLLLSEKLGHDVRFFSGSVPKSDRMPIMDDAQFDAYKQKVQRDFKNNDYTLLTATKAFGMGVNKGNIYYTIHYGIPGSMESLYQEAGRAGRDKRKFKTEKAKCYVLLSKHTRDQEVYNSLFDKNTSFSKMIDRPENGQVQRGLISQINGDLNTNLFLFSMGLDVIKEEYKVIKSMYETYAHPGDREVEVEGKKLGCNKSQAEKAIYRLHQLGIVDDWTIHDFFRGGKFEVGFNDYSDETIEKCLEENIIKYDKEFSLSKCYVDPDYANFKRILENAPESYTRLDKMILILLQWSYDNFAYNRRQSLKNIYENCCHFADGQIDKDEFKLRLENYFKFTQASFVLQFIAENPDVIEKWFEVFYQIDNNLLTEAFITTRQQEALRDNLSRFLEGYRMNSGLDFISGFLRLLLDDYDNIDGERRMQSALKHLKMMDESQIDFAIQNILKFGLQLSEKQRSRLAGTIFQIFADDGILRRIHSAWADEFSLSIIVDQNSKKLELVINQLYEGIRKIG